MQEIAVTTQIRYFALQVASQRSLVRWVAFVMALAATVTLNAPIGGGTGA
jgi:hypothetical protein